MSKLITPYLMVSLLWEIRSLFVFVNRPAEGRIAYGNRSIVAGPNVKSTTSLYIISDTGEYELNLLSRAKEKSMYLEEERSLWEQ